MGDLETSALHSLDWKALLDNGNKMNDLIVEVGM